MLQRVKIKADSPKASSETDKLMMKKTSQFYHKVAGAIRK